MIIIIHSWLVNRLTLQRMDVARIQKRLCKFGKPEDTRLWRQCMLADYQQC